MSAPYRPAVSLCALLLAVVAPARAGDRTPPPGAAHDAQRVAERTPDAPFLPSRHEVVAAMLALAEVGPGDVVYDLGSGDGRIVIAAAKRGARGVGVDIDPRRVREGRENAAKEGVSGRVEFHEQDLFDTDLSAATVVTLYLMSDVNLKLRPKLQRELKAGARVVSHAFGMGDWTPDRSVTVESPWGTHPVYLWTIPPQGRPTAAGS
jgi:SAM-dependent methyltransferase